MTPLADMVRRLIAAGCEPTEAAAVLSEVYALGVNSTRIQVDETAQKRREWDRQYRRKLRGIPPESTRIPPDQVDTPLIEERKKERKVSKRETRKAIPPDWQPNQQHTDLCSKLQVPLREVETTFRETTAAKGILYANHDMAFCTYIRNFHKFNGGRRARKSTDDKFDDLIARAKERELADDPRGWSDNGDGRIIDGSEIDWSISEPTRPK